MPPATSRRNSSAKPVVQDPPQSQWVMITEEKHFKDDNKNEEKQISLCKLRHPKSDQSAMFLICGGGETISEVVKFTPEYGSWLIGESVQRDGSIILTTPVDPIFLILPYLINAGKTGKFMTLDQIVHDEDFPDCGHILECGGLFDVEHVADMKGGEHFQAYRYNEDKTLAWLKTKAERVSEALRKTDVRVGERGAHSADFVRSKKHDSDGEDAYMKYAHGLVSDYLPLELGISLRDYLGIKETKENLKPDTKENGEPPSKKAKLSKDDITPTEDYSSNSKPKKENSKGKLTAAQKKLSQVDKTGMKSISSFFGAKS